MSCGQQKEIVKEWANLFGYEVRNIETAPNLNLHDFEAQVIYRFIDEACKEKDWMRIIGTALYMAKHGLTDANELPWKEE